MLTTRIEVSENPAVSAEDIFASAIDTIFPDETINCHGYTGSQVTYRSGPLGDVKLKLADPNNEDGRQLFAHYVWNAALLLAELISGEGRGSVCNRLDWSVSGERVLELGAGTGLAGLIAAQSGGNEVVISDYPRPEILATIEDNIENNISKEFQDHVTIQAHEWGVLEDRFSMAYESYFTRILSADCLWMPGEHRNLARSMLHFLAHEESARVWVTAGFHTGRPNVARFFDIVVDTGLVIEKVWERDVHGNERSWTKQPATKTEDAAELKKWLVIAILRHNLKSDQQ